MLLFSAHNTVHDALAALSRAGVLPVRVLKVFFVASSSGGPFHAPLPASSLTEPPRAWLRRVTRRKPRCARQP
jgi:hypothetical protein